MTKDTKEWLKIIAFIMGIAGIILLFYATNWKLSLAVFLLLWSNIIHQSINNDA